jgi:hypothetical protein
VRLASGYSLRFRSAPETANHWSCQQQQKVKEEPSQATIFFACSKLLSR